ncbi:MAG: VWA domain-containing protein [Planctomycetota bacterium]
MSLRFDEPVWLLTGAAGLMFAIAGWPWLVGFSRGRRLSAVLARTAVFTALAAVLGGASDIRHTDDLAVIAVVDASGSAVRFGVSDDGRSLDRRVDDALSGVMDDRGPDDLLGIVAFDGRAVAVASATRGDPTDRALVSVGAEGTDIASALELAAAMVPRGASGRIVLVTDGNETTGDALAAARRLSSRAGGGDVGGSFPVDVVPIAYRVGSETIVESVDAPPRARPGELVTVRVTLNSTAGTSGVLKLYRGGTLLDAVGDPPGGGRRVRVGAGKSPVLLDVVLPDARLHRFEAVFTPDVVAGQPAGDRFADNNRGEAFTVSPGEGSVLVVDGVSGGDPTGPGATLARALEGGGNRVSVVAPSGVPADLIGLQPYDLVFLQNVAADELPRGAAEALVLHVRELGAGLVMVGGPSSFGAGSWRGTPIEDVLPVRLDLPERLVVPETAIVLVLDSSGSMGAPVGGSVRSQQEIANAAAVTAVETLDERDLVGVIDFESDARWVRDLGPNTRPAETAAAVRRITAGGGTNLPPAMSLAGEALRKSEAKVKHIIVLTDGMSVGAQSLPETAAELAADGISVSTIGVGDGSDTQTLRAMAESGGGSFYNVTDPSVLPRVFVKAVRVVRSPMIREAPFEPVIVDASSPALGGVGLPPTLNGLVLTQFRDDPRAVRALATPDGEPVLAHWTVELGRVAAFTSDAWRWAEPWLDWDGYSTLWNQLARLVSRSSDGGRSVFRVTPSADGLELTYTAVDDRGAPQDLLSIPATIYDPGGSTREVTLNQVGPGLYRASVGTQGSGTYVAVATPRLGANRLSPAITGVSLASGVEYERLTSNTPLLEQITRATGGRVLALEDLSAERLWDREGIEPRVATASLWQNLVVLALIMLVLDVGTRKVAWDRAASTGTAALADAEKRAVATLSALRKHGAKRRGVVPAENPGVTAARPAAAEARRTAPKASPPAAVKPEVIDRTGSVPDDGPGGLLAAKRRASERFDRD